MKNSRNSYTNTQTLAIIVQSDGISWLCNAANLHGRKVTICISKCYLD